MSALSLRAIAVVATGVALLAACTTAASSPAVGVNPAETEPALPPRSVPDAASPDAAEDAPTSTTCATPCGLAPQCGCTKSETCDLDETGARACVSAGTAKAGFACLSTRECAVGLVCASGVCREPCATVGTPCPGVGAGACGSYPRSVTDGGAGGVAYAACAVTCAYDAESSCGFTPGDLLATACVYQPATGSVDCTKVRNVQLQSGVCGADAECGAGRVCIPSSDFSSCRRLCKVDDPKSCGGCKPFATARVVAGITYGFCP